MKEDKQIIKYIAHRLNVTAKDVAEFLQIDVRTLYNYANYTIDQLPTVAKDKFVDFFSKYDEFDAELDLRDVFDILENI
jgi:hypothetical protein